MCCMSLYSNHGYKGEKGKKVKFCSLLVCLSTSGAIERIVLKPKGRD
jgi:hypothetical protein